MDNGIAIWLMVITNFGHQVYFPVCMLKVLEKDLPSVQGGVGLVFRGLKECHHSNRFKEIIMQNDHYHRPYYAFMLSGYYYLPSTKFDVPPSTMLVKLSSRGPLIQMKAVPYHYSNLPASTKPHQNTTRNQATKLSYKLQSN